jgi:TonB family protein
VIKRVAIYLCTLLALASLCEIAITGAPRKKPAARIDAEKIREHVKYLASDALEGRGTGQKGGDTAAEYIAAQFKSYGLKPASDTGTYFQSVPMVSMKTLAATEFTLVPASGQPITLKNLDDFVTSNESQVESADVDAPVVFVGYGITAPEYQWDDYKGYDLKGKVALLFVNEPISNDPKFFKGKALTYYGRWTYKFEETARRGAVATLIIHRSDLASYGWDVVRNSWGSERSYLERDRSPKLQAASWIQLEVAKKLVGMAGFDLDKLFEQAQTRDFQPIELPVRLKAHVASQMRPFVSRNVVALLEGSDPNRNNEAVLYTAHYDHLGIDTSKTGDNIYNGAVDNATGCGILLELARTWAKAKKAPPRSVLFAAVTAEEQGLLGSEFLGKKLQFLPADPILDLNFDALAPMGLPEEVEVTGAERTTFYPAVEAAAKEFGFAIRPDANPEAGHYYRSDHFSLARVGIPSFSISQGLKFKGHDVAWGEAQARDYVKDYYHQPSDEYRADWDFKGLAEMASFGYELGLSAATQSQAIDWQLGDEFEKARKMVAWNEIDGAALFAGHPGLGAVHLEPIGYPPLARQTRISGIVVLQVSVAASGTVEHVEIVKGHPLLRQAAAGSVSKWKFATNSGEPRTFELQCEFALRGFAAFSSNPRLFIVAEPLHLFILASPPIINTVWSAS